MAHYGPHGFESHPRRQAKDIGAEESLIFNRVVHALQFYGAPPALESAAKFFILLMLIAGIFFISRALILLKGVIKPSKSDLIASILSIWVFPALIAMGNANTYHIAPYIPEESRSMCFYYLQIGALFIVIGIFNLSSLFLSIYLIRSRR